MSYNYSFIRSSSVQVEIPGYGFKFKIRAYVCCVEFPDWQFLGLNLSQSLLSNPGDLSANKNTHALIYELVFSEFVCLINLPGRMKNRTYNY